MRRAACCAAALAGLWGFTRSVAAEAPPDPYLWLEEVHGARAMAWVRAENAKTVAVLEKDPRYPVMYAQALAIAEADDRIPEPSMIGGRIYNFWQGKGHTRGYWRRTSLASYRTPDPNWETVLDLDQFAAAEHANWFLQGFVVDEPAERHCLVGLSDGGEDAVTYREFDIPGAHFVAGGFTLPRGKQDASWEDPDTLLVSREWEPGELTSSGYPYIVKRVHRGEPLAAAHEIFRGQPADVEVQPEVLRDGQGHRAVLVVRALSFFETEKYLVDGDRVRRLALPLKSEVVDMLEGRLIVRLRQDWPAANGAFKEGSLVAVPLAAAERDPDRLAATAIYVPGPRETLDDASATQDRLLVTTLDNVRGRAAVYRPAADGSWRALPLDLPDNSTLLIRDTSLHSNQAFLNVTSFLQPTSLWLADTTDGDLQEVKTLPPRFDASRDVVEQREAVSTDGTRVPYFIVHPRDMKADGSNPTLLYAYGGFNVSETPFYSSVMGKLWLERGGVFVLANIRGGGEFGPAWHDAGLKTHRQRVFDDFAAVARDLIARGVTSPRRLGIQGGSNGGLLMGVEFIQHPELWHAVDIQVPLLDMLRYEKIAAGSSWVAEYGSVSNPAEAAFLARISPYANIRKGVAYPMPFIWTTTKDDRVGPQHARKFAARLSEYGIPYLFYEVTEGGHGFGASLNERAHTSALEMVYLVRQLMGP